MISTWLAGATAAVALLLGPTVQATVLDDFNAASKSGWTDTLNSGTNYQAGGLFTITTAPANGSLTYSRKTSATFTNLAGHTLEFRVDVMTVSPAGANTNPLAILAWVPSGGAVLGNGYSLVVGAQDVKIQKGAAVLYSTNYAAAGTNIQSTNITLVLRLTPSGSAVDVNARVYKRIANGVTGQYFTALFDYTLTDASGLVAQGGNAALGVRNQASASGASIAFDNLQVFDTINTVFDDFNSGLDTSKWTVFKKLSALGDSVTVHDGQLDALATVADASGGFAGVYSANQTFKIIDGGRVEFQVDVAKNDFAAANSYSALGYLPVPNPSYIYGLVLYHIANDKTAHTVAVSGKIYNAWWGGRNDIQPPVTQPGCRYTLTMTGEGSNCRVESRIEDLSVADVNSPARVVWQSEFVDTPAIDCQDTNFPAPYLNVDGRFCITTFNAGALGYPYGPAWAEVLYDNAVARQTLPPRSAPILANVAPVFGANFLPSSTVVSFDATGGTNIPLDNLVVTLNGVRYTNGSPGVAITPSASSSTSRHFGLTGALTANVNYLGSVQATDAFGLTSQAPLVFDTFLTNNYLVESEEYNYGTNSFVTGDLFGGVFIDNPLLIFEGWYDANAYNAQPGVAEVDYHDNRGPWFGGGDQNHRFRTSDPVYTSRSGDAARAKYVNAGGPASGYYEMEVADIRDGDWLNYTHTYPAGTYNLFMRQATYRLADSLVTLERVTSSRTTSNQTTTVLGSFTAPATGIGLFANVPLSDAVGTPLVLRFPGGVDTLRVMNRVTGNADLDFGNLEQNYLVFVPVANPGTLRPVVSMVLPTRNSTLNSFAPVTTAAIVNRDTTVVTTPGAIQFLINGAPVAATITPTANGANVSYALSPLPAPGVITNTLIFQDSGGVSQTNTWTWSLNYLILRAGNSMPIGSLNLRGVDARMVQTDNGGASLDNTLLRAEQQLAIPPLIPYDRTATSIVQVLNWDKTAASPNNVPGLCSGSYPNIAVESLTYLELTAGIHRFHVQSDDRAGVYSGASLKDPSPLVLWENPGNTADATFDFVVETTGLYPIRCVWEETGGGAQFRLWSTNVATGGTEVLINDPNNPAGVVKAWYPIRCLSSSTVDGSYAVDATAVDVPTLTDVICSDTQQPINKMITGGTFTIPQAAGTRFYRLDSPRGTKITSITKSGGNIVLTYKVQ